MWTSGALSGGCPWSSDLLPSGISKPPVKTRWLVTGDLVPSQELPQSGAEGQPLTYVSKHRKTSTKWTSVSDFWMRPCSGREKVAETRTPSPDTPTSYYQHFSNMPSVKWPVGFVKVPYQGRPLAPPQALRMPKNNSKETYSVPPKGHLLVKNIWSDSQVVQRYRTRGAPFPIHKAPRMPKNSSKKSYLVPGPKARLRQGTFEKPRY